MGRRPLVAGNWKMHGTLQTIAGLLEGLKYGCERIETAELVVIPPYIFIPQCKEAFLRTQISWGAQDVSEHQVGAYTGEISATMLRDFCAITLSSVIPKGGNCTVRQMNPWHEK